MATIEDFKLRIQVEGQQKVDSLKSSINDLKTDIANFGQVGGPLGNTINGIIGKLGGVGMAAAAAGTAFVTLGMKAINLADELSDIGAAVGLTASQVMSFRESIVMAGGGLDDYQSILGRTNQSIQEAAAGNANLQKAFKEVGVYITDANGKIRPTSDIMEDLINRFQRGEISGSKFAAAVDIMGKAANRLDLTKLNIQRDTALDERAEQLANARTEIDKLYAAIEEKLIIAFGDFVSSIKYGGFYSAISMLVESIVYLAGAILNLPTDAIAGVWNALVPDSMAIKSWVGAGDAFKRYADSLGESRRKIENENKKLSEATANAPAAPDRTGPSRGGYGKEAEADRKAREKEEEKLKQILDNARQRVEEELKINEVIAQRNEFLNNNSDATDRERRNAEALFEIEKQRAAALTKIAEIKNLPQADRTSAEQQINDIYNKRVQLVTDQQQADYETTQSFAKGWNRSLRQYAEDSNNAYKQAGQVFNTVTSGMTDMFMTFIKTGKMEWSTFIESVLMDIVRLQIQKTIAMGMGALTDGIVSVVGGILSGGASAAAGGGGDYTGAAVAKTAFAANGGVFSGPGIGAYSNSVVTKPTIFPFAKGGAIGMMGEAGPEAILPLTRKNGVLGVQSSSGGGVEVNIYGDSQRAGTVNRRQDTGGNTIIDVFVAQVKSAMIMDIGQGGSLAGAMEGQYGLNRSAGAWR